MAAEPEPLYHHITICLAQADGKQDIFWYAISTQRTWWPWRVLAKAFMRIVQCSQVCYCISTSRDVKFLNTCVMQWSFSKEQQQHQVNNMVCTPTIKVDQRISMLPWVANKDGKVLGSTAAGMECGHNSSHVVDQAAALLPWHEVPQYNHYPQQ